MPRASQPTIALPSYCRSLHIAALLPLQTLSTAVQTVHIPAQRTCALKASVDSLPDCMSQAAGTSARAARGGSRSSALSDDSLDLDDATTTAAVRVPTSLLDSSSGSSSAIQSLTSTSTLSTLEGKLDLSPTDLTARRGLLREPFFDQWKDDTGAEQLESPEEMSRQDPIGTQIWRLYKKQRQNLPNAERLENLSWRMMSMNLKRKELERRQE